MSNKNIMIHIQIERIINGNKINMNCISRHILIFHLGSWILANDRGVVFYASGSHSSSSSSDSSLFVTLTPHARSISETFVTLKSM